MVHFRDPAHDVAVALAIVCLTALLEVSMGRTLTYRNGPIRPWVSEVHSAENSQQISDWYTFSLSYGYDGYAQWLANRGYAVLSVNYRGSLCFGRRQGLIAALLTAVAASPDSVGS